MLGPSQGTNWLWWRSYETSRAVGTERLNMGRFEEKYADDDETHLTEQDDDKGIIF